MNEKESHRIAGVYENLSGNLRFLRMLKGLSQGRVSEIVHVSRKHYCDCENGAAIPSLITTCLLADLFEVPVDTLLSAKVSYVFKEPEDEP